MSFWTGVSDWFGFKPIDDAGDFFQNVLSGVTMGGYNARDNSFNPFRSFNAFGPGAAGLNSELSGSVGEVSEVGDMLDNLGLLDYMKYLTQTDQEAALQQAQLNESAAESSWLRSEQSADAAMRRSRDLRSTYYQDLVKSLTAAGLNPVLAATNGIGGVSSAAPQGSSQASSSSKAEGLNAANLLQAIAAILSGAGSLVGNLNPLKSISKIDSNGALSNIRYNYGRR